MTDSTGSTYDAISASVLPFVLFRQIKSNLIMLKARYSAEVKCAEITEALSAAVTILKELSGLVLKCL